MLRRPGVAFPAATAAPRGQLRPVVHQDYANRAVRPEWVTNGLWRWNNGASAAFTLDGLANVTGGGVAEATNATATWSAEPNSTIGYAVGPGSGSVIHMDALTSPCGWTSCLTGSGMIGCGGFGGAGTNDWRGETYVTITSGEVWLRSYCSLNAFDSTTTQSVLTHELGHTLGLGHSDQGSSPHDVCIGDENLAIMRSVVQYRTTLGTDDSDGVRWLYGDGGNSCNATAPPPPTVTTNAASGVGQMGATLKGTVNPNGTDTSVTFEYGATTGYGSTTAPQAIGAGTSPVAVNQAVSNLACGMPYHFRVVATTAFATTPGLDQTFTTTACSATKFYTLTPCRIADTRNAVGPSGGPALSAGEVRNFPAAGLCGIPSSARAIAVNLAVYLPGDMGDLRAHPAGGTAPMASSLNFRPGIVRSNSAVVPLGSGGQVAIQCDMPSSGTNVFIDVFGYFQ
jgi:hypothetical protein